MTAIVVITLFALPVVILWLTGRNSAARSAGPIVLCYGVVLMLGNLGLIPESSTRITAAVTELTVALALPMLLFSLDLRSWSKSAGRAMLSLVFSTTAVVAIATLLFWMWVDHDPIRHSHLAAMSVGVYTGGTVNLAAIKQALGIPNELYILFHSLDTLIGGVYLLLMVSIAIPFFRKWLPQYKRKTENKQSGTEERASSSDENYAVLLKLGNARQIGAVILLAVAVLGASLVLTKVAINALHIEQGSVITILLLTSLGILLSLSPRVRSLQLSYKLGMYLIYVFCVAVASMARFESLSDLDAGVVVFLLGAVVGSVLLHALLCKLAKVDSDTFMVTSVSAICSPPFVPMMAKALGNREVLLSGMTTGIIGFAIGNYLGVTLALILQALY